MNFRRTESGLSNQHLFYRVDAIVFVEGGKSYSKEEVVEGKFDSNTLDIQFWRRIFSIFHKKETLQFRAIGSKSTLKSIAADVATGKISRVYIAMDRDFDEFDDSKIWCKGVLYTHGYSWENDVCQKDVLEEILDALCVYDCNINDLKSEVLEEYDKFLNQIRSAVCADALLSLKSKSFFNRKKHLSYLKIYKKAKPQINEEKILSSFKECNLSESIAIEHGKINKIHPLDDCLGHLLFDYCYHLAAWAIKNIGNLPKIAKFYFGCVGIDKFVNRISDGSLKHIFKHYKSCFESLQ